MGASGFPMDDTYPEFALHNDVLRYIHSYIKHFDLFPHIRTSCPVQSILHDPVQSQWNVVLQDPESKPLHSDFMILCTGVFSSPTMPQEWQTFSSPNTRVLHGSQYIQERSSIQQSLQENGNQKILIVGCSDSACDIATDLFQSGARNMYMTSHKGAWYQGKSVGYGKPADMFYSLICDFVKRIFGCGFFERWIVMYGLTKSLERYWGKSGLGLKEWAPEGSYISTAYVKSRSILSLLHNGSVTPVRKARPNSDGTVTLINQEGQPIDTTSFDRIIVCSGYKFSPGDRVGLQDPTWVQPQNLYKMTFSHTQPTLAVVGNVRPYVTSIVTMSEFQAWRVAHAFAHGTLPSKGQRACQMKQDKQEHRQRFPTQHERLPFLVDPYDFVRGLAEEVGTNQWWIGLPWAQQLRIFFMSWTPSVYRLQQKGKDSRLAKEHVVRTYETNRASRGITKTNTQVLLALVAILLLSVVATLFLCSHTVRIGMTAALAVSDTMEDMKESAQDPKAAFALVSFALSLLQHSHSHVV